MSDPKHIPESARWRLYELEKQAWAERHPEATHQEYEQAIREIAKRCGV